MALSTSEFKGRFGFGAMRLPMRGGEPDFELCNQMFDRFLEAGLNYFDTAHVYLGGKSEVALRESLVKRHSRESFFLVDKLTHGTFRDPASIRKVFQEELDACGVEYFDLLLAHAVNAAYYEMYERQGVFETAKELVAEGRARHFGISYHDGPELLERILCEHPEIEAVVSCGVMGTGALTHSGNRKVCQCPCPYDTVATRYPAQKTLSPILMPMGFSWFIATLSIGNLPHAHAFE